MAPAYESTAERAARLPLVSIGYKLVASLFVAALMAACGGGGQGNGGTASAMPGISSTSSTSSTSSGTGTSTGSGTPTAGSDADTPCVASSIGVSNEAALRLIAGDPFVAGDADGGPHTARFNQPGVLTLDAKGNLYVSDDGNRKIRKVCPGGNVSTVANAGALTAFPVEGLAADSHGSLYFSDLAGVHKIVSPTAQVPIGSGLAMLGRLAIGSQDVMFTFENRYAMSISDPTASQPPAGLRKIDGTQVAHTWDYAMPLPQGTTNNTDGFTDMVIDEGAKQVYIASDRFNVVSKLSYATPYSGIYTDVPGIDLPGDQRIQRLAADSKGAIYAFTNVLGMVYRILPDDSVVAVAGAGTQVSIPSAGQLQIRSIVGTGPRTFAFTAGNAVYELKLP